VIDLGLPGGPFFVGPSASGEPCAGLAGRAERHAVQPGAEQVRVADRPGLSGQDEEDGLESVLSVMVVAQELPADAQDHRPMSGHDRGEGGLVGRLAAGGEPLEQFAVGEPGGAAALEERAELSGQ
jgi:hypothetical protein